MPYCKNYFSKATTRWIEKPTVAPQVEIVSKFQDDDGDMRSTKPSKQATEKPKKKKYLPGERLLRKLTKTRCKDRTMERIQNSIKKNVRDNFPENHINVID